MESEAILQRREEGLYCPAGDFFIDPWKPVHRCVISHCHSDHARGGCGRYLAARRGLSLLQARMGSECRIQALDYGEKLQIQDVVLSLHPAGHMLGSSQIRIEFRGQVWVVSGDYKTQPDPSCDSFQLQRCHTFVTESTFGLPIFRWPDQQQVFSDINDWWSKNQTSGKTSLLYAYAAGKAQRIIMGLDPSIGPIFAHGAVHKNCELYREEGVSLPTVTHVSNAPVDTCWSDSLVVAPPSAQATPWVRRFGQISSAFASGWMTIRGLRRRRGVDRGFVLSDHVDWNGLMNTIDSTGAEQIWVTHGYASAVVRHLNERGISALEVSSRSMLQSGGES